MPEAFNEVITGVSGSSGTNCLKIYVQKYKNYWQVHLCEFTCMIGRKTSKVTLSSALCSTTSFFTSLSVGF